MRELAAFRHEVQEGFTHIKSRPPDVSPNAEPLQPESTRWAHFLLPLPQCGFWSASSLFRFSPKLRN